MRLDPDGCLVRRHRASDITTTEDTGAGETANWQRNAMRHTPAKKCQRVCKGDILPLDRSLLMGVPAYVDTRQLNLLKSACEVLYRDATARDWHERQVIEATAEEEDHD
jgi:hypothetical protein